MRSDNPPDPIASPVGALDLALAETEGCELVTAEEARFLFDTSGRTEKDMGWETHLWDFVADADETTLEIYSPMTEGPFAGPAIDQVRVVPVR